MSETITVYLVTYRYETAEVNKIIMAGDATDERYEEVMATYRNQFMRFSTEVYFRKAITYSDSGTDMEILNRAYQEFNIGGTSLGVADAYRDARNRSLSVGDVVSISGSFYACELDGWERLTDEQADAMLLTTFGSTAVDCTAETVGA